MVEIDLNFKRSVLDMMMGGDKLAYCYQCGKCNDVCPISQKWGSRYNPRDLVLFSALGYKNALIAAVGRDPFALWGCTTCETCDEMCPAEIPITDIIGALKNVAVSLGACPDFYIQSSKTIQESGMSIPSQAAIEKRREQLGIGKSPNVPINEVQEIMKATGMDSLLNKEA